MLAPLEAHEIDIFLGPVFRLWPADAAQLKTVDDVVDHRAPGQERRLNVRADATDRPRRAGEFDDRAFDQLEQSR